MSLASSPQLFSRRIATLTRVAALAVVTGAVLAAIVLLGTGRPDVLPMAASAMEAERLVYRAVAARTSNDTVFRPLF